jgi:hypothetical protein
VLINRRQVLKVIHENGLKGSKEFYDSIDQFVAMQVIAAIRDTKHRGKIILKMESICHLLPEVVNGR